jgi:hypothetical protein
MLDGTVYGAAMAGSILLLLIIHVSTPIKIPAFEAMDHARLVWTILSFSVLYAIVGYLIFARFRDLISLRVQPSAGLIPATVFERP